MKQILIKQDTRKPATRNELGRNSGTKLKRANKDWCEEGYYYADDAPLPVETPQDGYRWKRAEQATEDDYGWQQVIITPVYGEVSKRIFFKRMTALGKWKQFKTLIKQDEDVKDLYDNSAGLDIDDPDVIALSPAIKAELELTDEEYKSLFLVN